MCHSFSLKCRIVIVVVLLAACGQGVTPLPADTPILPTSMPITATSIPRPSTAAPIPPTATSVPPAEIFQKNKSAMDNVKSFHMSADMTIAGGGQTVDIQMEGVTELPDKAYMQVTSDAQTYEVVTLDNDRIFMREPDSEIWIQTGGAEQSTGYVEWDKFARSPRLLGVEKLDGLDAYRVAFDVDMRTLAQSDPSLSNVLSLGRIEATGEAWFGHEDFLTRRVTLVMTMELGSRVTYAIDVNTSEFNAPVKIPEPTRSIARTTLHASDPVFEVAFSADGKQIAACDDDQMIYLWSVSNLDAQPQIIKHPDLLDEQKIFQTADFYALAFSPDGRTLAAGTEGKVLLYSLSNLAEEPTALIPNEKVGNSRNNIGAVAYSPDGKYLAAGGTGSIVHIWTTDNLKSPATKLTGHTAEIIDLAFTPDGKNLVSAGRDGKVMIWSMSNLHARPKVLSDNKGPVYSIDMTPDGETLLSAGYENPVLAWTLSNLNNQPEMLVKREDPAIDKAPTLAIAVSPDGKILATADVFGTIRLWRLIKPDVPFATLRGHGQYDIMTIAFSPDGKYLVSGGGDALVNVWGLPEEW
jgi:WD40 repeat protein